MSVAIILAMLSKAGHAGLERKPIPAEARKVIQEVHVAAKAKNFTALRSQMVSEFTWSFGGDGDASQAIDAWRRDPAALRELHRVTGGRCVFYADDKNIQCPPNAGYRYRAGFTKTEQGWRMSYFVAGD
ncbi:hypothetical protein GCM10027277_55480 [Pseudoduganella ginsengisoli]|uniref:Uncharacterized protein n=1 Tax=Pseudoduganella ginsengisoli TaxID=1462440 RepID=A0A6L6Q520_9BURK|nr:hypothetical protein [Pseudoduganella ginsengisoli]MTW04983.1 hypothetical protein [Pseudoduganella ginsengisoli]